MKGFHIQGACSLGESVKGHGCPINTSKIFIQGGKHLRKGLKSFKGQELDRRKANLPGGENIQHVINLICLLLQQGTGQALVKHGLGVSEGMLQT